MQNNTFRQAQGTPMATTFATNHIRQVGIGLAIELRHRKTGNKSHREKWGKHCCMLLFFLGGATVGTVFCRLWLGRAIWLTLLPLGCLFQLLLREDLRADRETLERKPPGH